MKDPKLSPFKPWTITTKERHSLFVWSTVYPVTLQVVHTLKPHLTCKLKNQRLLGEQVLRSLNSSNTLEEASLQSARHRAEALAAGSSQTSCAHTNNHPRWATAFKTPGLSFKWGAPTVNHPQSLQGSCIPLHIFLSNFHLSLVQVHLREIPYQPKLYPKLSGEGAET